MTGQREQHPIRDNIGEWIEKEVEVSNNGTDWYPAVLIGFDHPNFAVLREYVWQAWRYCRPPQPKCRVPTDKDVIEAMATKGERLACWVKNHKDFDWQEAILFKVWSGGNYRFVASIKDGQCDSYRLCEIEDKP